MKRRGFAAGVAAGCVMALTARGDVHKANNADALDLGSSWVEASPPGSNDVAVWDSTVASANSPALGAAHDWAGIRIVDPGGLVTINGAETLTLGSSGIDLSGAAQNLTLPAATLVLGASQPWNVGSNCTVTVGGPVQGGVAASLINAGAGTLALSGANTYNGATIVTGGIARITSNAALGSTSAWTVVCRAGGTGPNYTDATGQLQLDGGAGNLTIEEPLNIDGHSQYNYQGPLRSTAGNNAVNGPITLGGSGVRISVAGGSLAINGTVARSGGSSMLVANAGGGLTLTFNNAINTDGGNFLCHGGGIVALNAPAVVGQSQIQYGTTLKLGMDNALPTDKTLLLGNTTPGTGRLDLNGHSQTVAQLTQQGDGASELNCELMNSDPVNAGTFTLSSSVANTYKGRITGKLNLTKEGAGSLTLTSQTTLTYSGATTVAEGTLTMNGSLASGNITVNGGTFNGTGVVHFTINGGTADRMILNGGALDITQLKLDLDVGAAGATGAYVVVDYSGGGTFTHNGAPYYFASLNDSAGFVLFDDTGNKRLLLVSTVFLWDGGDGSSLLWTTATNWAPDGAKPISDSNTLVIIDGNFNVGTQANPLNQDIAAPLTLNTLWTRNPTGGGDPTNETHISGNQLRFVTSSLGATPVIRHGRKGSTYVWSAIQVDAPVLTIKSQTWDANLRGKLSGPCALVFDPTTGAGGMSLDNSSNDYSGGTVWSANDTTWDRGRVWSSGSLGTGPVTLSGGNTSSWTSGNPSFFGFFGTGRTHSNDFVLAADATISIGSPETAGESAYTVSLTGGFNLDNHTLYVRGRGVGTISGTIHGSGGITKIDDFGAGQTNRWILAGTNTYTGTTTVRGGALEVNGSLANANVVVEGGVFGGNGTVHYRIDGATTDLLDLNGGTLDVTQLTLDFDVGGGGAGECVVVDYSGGGTFTNNGPPNYFGALADVPNGCVLLDDAVNKRIVLVPPSGTVLIVR